MNKKNGAGNSRDKAAKWVYGSHILWSKAFLLFILLNFCIFMGFDILLPTMSLYLEQQKLTGGEIGVIYGTFTISAILTRSSVNYFTGKRFSALSLITCGLLVCALASIGYYWGTTAPKAIFFRLMHGAGFGITSTLITSLVSQVIPKSRMGEGMGYLGLGTTVALAAGPLFGIWIMNDLGFFVMFATVSACYLLGIAVVGALPNISLVSAGPGIPRYRPILFSKLVRLPSLLMFILGLILSAIIIYMALFCEERGIPYAGHFFVLSTISIVISRLYAGRIHDRLGHRFVVIPAIMLLCITALLVFFARDGLLIFIASILYGFGLGAIFPSMTALTLSYAPLERRTEVTASFFNSYDLGFGAGSMLMGHVAELAGSYEVVFMSSAGMAALFLLVYSVYYLVLKKA